MSTVQFWSLKNALEARAHLSEPPILNQEVLASGEDFVVTCLNTSRVVDTGFLKLKLDTDLRKKRLSIRKDFKKNHGTEFAQQIKTSSLGPGLLACQRESIKRTQVGKVLGCPDFSIGDVSITNLVKRKSVANFFSLINTDSIFSRYELGFEVGGFTHPTIQLNGGPCKLPFHIEHWGAVSLNVLHWGHPKVWYIIHPNQFLPAILEMRKMQECVDLGEFWGVCDDTTSHRDIFYDPTHLSIQYHRVVQLPGEAMFLPPFALHAVENVGENCAESMNFMPPSLFPQCAAYKTCSHSEGIMGKPLFTTMTAKIEELYSSGQISLHDFIHSSDPLKSYKLRVVQKQMKDGNEKRIKEVVDHIKQKATTPTWFEFILPLESDKLFNEHGSGSSNDKDFLCPACKYCTNNYCDLKKHMGRKHEQLKVPQNTNRVKCPDCGKVFRCLRKHKGSQICRKKSREV